MKPNKLDYLDFGEVNSLLEGFNKTTGFVTAILDLEGNVLSQSGWRKICTDFHRINPGTVGNCRVSDTVLANKLGAGEKYHFYECLNGLVDVAVPIVIKGEHIANLFSGQFFLNEPDRNFFREQAKKYGFDETEYLDALESVPVVSKEKVKIAMDFLLNMTQMISEITLQKYEQSHLSEAIKKSEERFRGAFDQILEGCQIIGFDWRYIYLNRSAEVHNRRPNIELLGNRYMDMWPGIEDTEIFKIISQTLENRLAYHLENEFIFPDGSPGWFDLSIQPVPEGVFILSIDITERKKKEKELFESEFRFSLLYENGPFGMVLADEAYRFRKANPMFCSIMGYTEEEIKKITFRELTHPDDLAADLQNVRRLMNKEISVYRTEKRYIRKDGIIIWGALTVTSILDISGKFLYNLGIVEDITRRKNAEEKITQLNERISTATRASRVGIWDWDVRNNVLTWDDMMYELYGMKRDHFAGAYEAWLKGLHPDDRESSRQETQLAISGKKDYDTEFRIIWPDGSLHIIKAKGEVFRDEKGDPVRMVGINYDITEQKKAEDKVREKDLEFRKLSSNIPDMIFQFTRKTDGSYCVPIASEGIKNIFGCRPEDVINDFSPIATVIHPDDAERVIHDIEYSARHLTYFKCEFRVQIPGREIQWIYSNSSPEKLSDGSITWYGYNVDITNRKITEEALRDKGSRLELAMQTSNMAWWEMDINTGSVTFDDRKALMLGYSPDQFTHYSDFTSLLHPEDLNKAMDAMRKHISGLSDKYEVEYRIRKNSGEYLWFYDIGAVVKRDNNNNPALILGFVMDISYRKKAEDEIRKLNETLEERVVERTSQLKEANQELEAFSYSVSHDLRSPLRHINGFAEILVREYNDLLPEDAHKLLDTIILSAKKMGTLIDDLLSFSRNGRAELKKSAIDMKRVVDESLIQIGPSLKGRNIQWKISKLPDVKGDYNLLLMVWTNLIDNAVKYTRAREKAVIKIGYKKEERETVFFIKDNGVGFDMQYAHKLFGVFQRLHPSSQFEGTGIGLANVRRIILRHGGRIWVQAKPDKGATFYFSIPKGKE